MKIRKKDCSRVIGKVVSIEKWPVKMCLKIHIENTPFTNILDFYANINDIDFSVGDMVDLYTYGRIIINEKEIA